MPAFGKICYMDIDAREYQSRTAPLPTAAEVAGGQTMPGSGTKEIIGNTVAVGRRGIPTGNDMEGKGMPSAAPVISREEKASRLEAGRIYPALVKGHQGKKVKFKLDGMENIYGFFSLEQINIPGKEIGKDQLKEVFPVDGKIRVRYKGKEGDSLIWECVDITG